MPQVTLQRATIEYRELGPADSSHPPILFVHGILVDHKLWLKVAEELARNGFRCILPDWPLGSHTVPVDQGVELTPATVAEMIDEFIGALDLHDVTLVGNDTGGGLCQLLIDAHPDSVGRLVLTNCDAFDKFPPFPFTVVFAMMRGPRSIGLLSKLMKVAALRRSPLGYGLLLRPEDDALTASWVEPMSTDRRIAESGHAVAWCRRNGSHRCRHPAPTVRQAGHDRVGNGRPQFHAVARPQARGAVPERDDGRGARCADVRRARRPAGGGRCDRDRGSPCLERRQLRRRPLRRELCVGRR
ncbi:MAG: hypothetical protein QOI28_5262 [Mycobacterium sp.]|nr:hypothetical protein [Mycobacterium sp.]